jgi:hypothetical protein
MSDGLIQPTVPVMNEHTPDIINTSSTASPTTEQGVINATTSNYSIVTSIAPTVTVRKESTFFQSNPSLTASPTNNQENAVEKNETRMRPVNKTTSLSDTNQKETKHRNSNRCKKLPVRSDDFLW